MGRKTGLRRLFKYLPVSIELATAAALDGKVDHDSQALDTVLSGEYQVVDDDAPIGPTEEEQPEQPEQEAALEHTPDETIDRSTGEIKTGAQASLAVE
ncbi:hypothetical protein D9M69_709360 [compost metagenome]